MQSTTPRQWRPRYPGVCDADQSREPPAIHIVRTADRDWSEARLRDFATGLHKTAQTMGLTAQQRRDCLEEAETAQRYADNKQAPPVHARDEPSYGPVRRVRRA